MRTLLLIFLLFIGVSAPAQSTAPVSEFAAANELFRLEKFSEAAQRYESIINRNKVHSAELYYNLGNSYYKLNKIGPAVFYYEKALLLDPGNKTIKNNLKFAHNMMLDEVKDNTVGGFSAVVHNFTGQFLSDTWAWMTVVAGFLFLGAFAGYFFSAQSLQKRIFFVAMLLMLFFAVAFLSAAFFEQDFERNNRPAIVFAPVVSVKGEPKENASDAASIHEGTKVYILESLDGWNHVMLPDGNDGWLKSDTVKEIK